MGILDFLKDITNTNAVIEARGKCELQFFEFIYRYYYVVGLSSMDKGLAYLVYSSFAKATIASFIASELWYLFTEAKTLDAIIDNFNVTVIHLMGLYRYFFMMQRRGMIKSLSTAMESPNFDIATKKRKNLVSYWAERNILYLKLLLGIGSSTILCWYTFPIFDDIEYNLMIPVRLPFEYRYPGIYPLAYILVMVSFTYTASFVMVNDCLMQAYMMHILCQYEVLSDCFENILQECGDRYLEHASLKYTKGFYNTYIRKLRSYTEQHQFLLQNGAGLRDLMNAPLLGQMVASFMLICCLGFQVMTTATVNYIKILMSVFYLFYSMFELFIFCQLCDEIKSQSQNICNSVYSSGWEGGITSMPGVRSHLLLVMIRATKPLELTAGGMMDVSLMAYTDLVKASYSALTMLLRLKK